jgi:hypothetical protein
MNTKVLFKKMGISFILGIFFVVGSVVYAAATIPGACSVPGTCTDITSTFQAVSSKTSMKFLGSNATNFVALQASSSQSTDITLTLPSTTGANGDVLSTDGTGVLSWTASADRFLGMIAFMMPHAGSNIHEINGQTVTDAKLATYINANPITGFSVVGNDVTLPDWRGRYLGASGNRGISATAGTTYGSTNKSHRHTESASGNANQAVSTVFGNAVNVNLGTTLTNSGFEGSTYARPETAAMPMVIVGGRNLTIVNSTLLNDQAASGYIDLGTMRMQWGTDPSYTGSSSITFPQPFKTGTVPFVTVTKGTSTGGSGFTGATDNLQFGYYMLNNTSTAATTSRLDWQAIGLKP